MLRKPDNLCWNDIKRKWEPCPPVKIGGGGGRIEFVTDPFERCCLAQGCCINCFQLTEFVNCITNIFWNNDIWGWGNPSSGPLKPVDWAGAYRSWTIPPNGCLMKPEPGAGAPLPAQLYFNFPDSLACYTLSSINYAAEDSTTDPALGDEVVTCFTFTSGTPGCLDFSVCWKYRFEPAGSGDWRRVLLETRTCINNSVSEMVGINGSLDGCEACSRGATPTPPPCLIGLENPTTGATESTVTINIGNISLSTYPTSFDWYSLYGDYLKLVIPPCCGSFTGNFNSSFNGTHIYGWYPDVITPPIAVGYNNFNVTYNLTGNLGSGVATVRYVTDNCDRMILNIVYNIVP